MIGGEPLRFSTLVLCMAALTAARSELRGSGHRRIALNNGEVQMGPEDCVSLFKNKQAHCEFRTQCDGVDTATFEFDFICVSADNSKKKHTFGEGGFDSDEDYDTGVACHSCLAPDDESASAPPTESQEVQRTLVNFAKSKKTTGGIPPKGAAFFGPDGCIATYRSDVGTCIVQTRCTAGGIADYSFGVNCAVKDDVTRHIFGPNSFDPEETFDTQIKCDHCLAIDDEDAPVDRSSLGAAVDTLKGEMSSLKAEVEQIAHYVGVPEKNASGSGDATTTAAPEDAETEGGVEEQEEGEQEEEVEEGEGDEAAPEEGEEGEGDEPAAPAADDEGEDGEEEEATAFLHHHGKHKHALVRKVKAAKKHKMAAPKHQKHKASPKQHKAVKAKHETGRMAEDELDLD